jgi:dephospho-CoA kinase
MHEPIVIAICGAKRTGKDTLAKHLVNSYGYHKLAFADPLKQAVSALFGFSEEQLGDGDDKDMLDEKWCITPRKALQFFGTEVLQYKIQELLPLIDRGFLAYSLANRIRQAKDGRFVISDMRFLHEYEELKKLRVLFVVIRVDRERLETVEETHCSEIEYMNIPYDFILHNDKDIQTFLQEADKCIQEMMASK